MATKKIAFYIGSLNRGGAETLLVDIFNHTDLLPYEVVCIYRNDGNLTNLFCQTGVRMIKLPRKRSWLLYVVRFRRLLKKEKVDIVHSQTSLNAIIAVLSTRFTKINVVNTFHGFDFAQANRALRKLVFKGCRRLIFVSRFERQFYLERGDFGVSDKCDVVYNGISFVKFAPLDRHSCFNNPLKMCMVGSFGSGRNHLFVCHFLNLLKERGIDYKFYYIGAARESERNVYDDCYNYCKEHNLLDRVEFKGLCNNVPQQLSMMDAFVYSTRHDSFGISVIEAIASGLPTFVNDWGVMKEITNDGEYAVLYPSEDLDALFERFNSFLANRTEYERLAQKSAMAVRERYSIEAHISQLSSIYAQILHK